MTNEEIVENIRNGYSVTKNMQLLYDNNLALIKRYVKPYTAYESMEDLLQEAYFGLWEAVQHYETSENTLFMTYASYWIRSAVVRYIEKCGSVIKISSEMRQRIYRYNKTVDGFLKENGRMPTNQEIISIMNISLAAVEDIKVLSQGISSIDAPLKADDELTVCDNLKADFDIENDVLDKIYNEYEKNDLWGLVERYTSERENKIIKDIFVENRTLRDIAKEQDVAYQRIRQIKENGLRRLRHGKAKREILAKLDIVEASAYRTGLNKFRINGESTVEYIAIRNIQLKNKYKQIV